MSKTSGCFTIVIHAEGYILLAKEKRLSTMGFAWRQMGKGRGFEKCTVRETFEETGSVIAIKGKIGECFQPHYDDLQHIFVGKVIGGSPLKKLSGSV